MEVDFLHKNIWQNKAGKGKGLPSSWHASVKNIFALIISLLFCMY